MNIDLAPFIHEIASIVIGGLVTLIGRKAMRVARDVNCTWDRIRNLEDKVFAIQQQLSKEKNHG